jgi:hypothetical protein
MRRLTLLRTIALSSLLPLLACGKGGDMGPSSTSYRGTASDAAGDAASRNGERSHDLTGATFEVASGQVTLTVTFAPGTLSGADGAWAAFLDTDENVNTGDPYGLTAGMDYAVVALGSSGAVVRYASGSSGVEVARTAITQLSDTNVRTTFPLSALNDDGRFLFSLFSVWLSADGLDGEIADVMPEFDKVVATR